MLQLNHLPTRHRSRFAAVAATPKTRHAQHVHQSGLLDRHDVYLRDGSQVLTLTPLVYAKNAGRYRALVARPGRLRFETIRFETIVLSASEALVIG